MKHRKLPLLILIIILVSPYPAHAQLQFNCDFNQDTTYETSWVTFPGQAVTADIYVSSVPVSGLINFGFYLDYNSSVLDLDATDILVDSAWYTGETEDESGKATITGLKCPICGISGDDIRLVTITFYSTAIGICELWMRDRGETVDDFVLVGGTVLDSDLGNGVLLGTVYVHRVGDFDGDGDIDGVDLGEFAYQYSTCTAFCLADINSSGTIDSDDLLQFGAVYGDAE